MTVAFVTTARPSGWLRARLGEVRQAFSAGDVVTCGCSAPRMLVALSRPSVAACEVHAAAVDGLTWPKTCDRCGTTHNVELFFSRASAHVDVALGLCRRCSRRERAS